MTADAALSNRARRDAKRKTAKPARRPKAAGQTTTSAAVVAQAELVPTDRDGLLWLLDRGRFTPHQGREAKDWRKDYREAAADGALLKSCLDDGGRGGSYNNGKGGGLPAGGVVQALDAQRRLWRKRYEVLHGQVTLIELLDGVCGRGLTLTALANGNDRVAAALELVLKVGLDMLAASRVT